MMIDCKEMIRLATVKWGDDYKIRKATGISLTTIWRMRRGDFNFHAKTVGKLVKALNE